MRNKKQQLSRELKNTPTDTSLVCSSVRSGLNKEETLSVQNKVLIDNNSEENSHSGKSEQGLRVPVINMRGKPLMPTRPRKARMLVKQGKAKVTKRTPFVIQLTMPTGETKQAITLGIDSGYSTVGFSAVTKDKELMSGELTLRKRVPKLIEQKKGYRRTRRSKLWYREPRFNNRTRKEGWLPPSSQNKLDTHIKLIAKLKSFLPVTKTIIEVATFDTQKMCNPEISGIEYQQGELQGYHIREYLLQKWGRRCVYCGEKNLPLEIEHINPKSRGGSSRVNNLTISCRKCNMKKGTLTAEEFGYPKIQKLAEQSLKQTVFMNVIRKMLAKQINAEETFGYETKYKRIKYDIGKSHVNDAFVIAEGSNQERCKSYLVTQTRRNNRSIQTNRKGYNPSIRRKRYGLQPNDLVRYYNETRRVKGVFNYGTWARLEDGTNTNIKNVELIQYGKGIQFN